METFHRYGMSLGRSRPCATSRLWRPRGTYRHRPCPLLIPERHIKSQASDVENTGPLRGIRILDLSRVLAAPFCVQILADYGAEVIKVEDVARGDDTRYWKIKGESKAWKKEAGPMSNYFASINRNKRSICLDLKSDEGRDIFLKLVENSDVVVDNFRPGTLEKLKIGYDALSRVNPRVVHASISGYGPSGPSAMRAGYDMIAGAEAGLLHLTGERNGPPVRPGLGLTDMSTGLFAHGAIIAALYARDRTGRGQKIDASLFESQVAILINVGMSWLNMGQETARWGTQHPSVVPYDAFKTKDLYFVCGATNDKQFQKLCDLLGLDELAADPKFSTNADRVEHRDELFPRLNEVFATRTTDEWLAAFEGSGMPYAPINTMERVFEHPQTKARDMIHKIGFDASQTGDLNLIGPPVKFSDTKATIRQRPPLLGEHTEEILSELGFTNEQIEGLKASKTVANNVNS